MEIKQRLDRYIIGQDSAKEVLSVAVYNHYKRLAAEHDLPASPMDGSAVEVGKANILLLEPSGTGKTLLASTLRRGAGSDSMRRPPPGGSRTPTCRITAGRFRTICGSSG